MSKRAWRGHLLVLLGYTLLTVAITWPLLLHIGTALPGEGSDSWQYLWNFWWFDQALLDGQALYSTPAQYYPGASLLFHTLSPLHSLLGLPARLAGHALLPGRYLLAYNFVVLLSGVLSGYATYLLAREVLGETGAGAHGRADRREAGRATTRVAPTGDTRKEPKSGSTHDENGPVGARRASPLPKTLHIAAFLAGAIFTLAPYRSAHLLGHLSLIATETLPLFALFAWRALRQPGWRAGLGLGLSWLAAALIDWYYPLYMGLLAGFFLLWALGEALLQRRTWKRLLHSALTIGGGLLAAALLLAPLLWPMLQQARTAGYLQEPLVFSATYGADLLAFFLPSPLHPLWGDFFHRWTDGFAAGNTAEGVVYLGLTALALAGVGLWRERRQSKLWATMAACFGLLALGPTLKVLNHDTGLPLPYRLLLRLPIVQFTRVPSRYAVLAQLALALLAGLGLYGLLKRLRPPGAGRRAWLTAGLVLLLLLVEYAPVPYPLTPAEIPPFYQQLAQDPRHYALLELPTQKPNQPWYYTEWMLHQTVHGKWSFRGYISRGDPLFPFGGAPVLRQLDRLGPTQDIHYDDYRALSSSVLGYYRVGYVVLEKPRLAEQGQLAAARELVQELLGPAGPAYSGDFLEAYAVEWGPVGAFTRLGTGWHEVEQQPWGPFRWMERDRAELYVILPEEGAVTLTFLANSFYRPRALQAWLGDSLVGEWKVGTTPESYTLSLRLPAGESRLELRAAGYEIPQELGAGDDSRALSVGLSELRITR